MKEQVNNLEELSKRTTSKLHSTHLPPLEAFYQSQKIPFQSKTEMMSFINWTVRIVKLFMLEKQKEPSTSEPMSTSQLSGLPYVRERLITVAQNHLARMHADPLVEHTINSARTNIAWGKYKAPISILKPPD